MAVLPLHPVLIAPPFGRWLRLAGCSATLGSYTVHRRAGLIGQALRTIRPVAGGGWVNAMGLRNPGIAGCPDPGLRADVISLAALDDGDWARFADHLMRRIDQGARIDTVELNLSCPNAAVRPIGRADLARFAGLTLIAKLPPLPVALDHAERLIANGVTGLHLGNTLPTPRGGLSGPPLRTITPGLLAQLRSRLGPDVPLIGGGGIQTLDHACLYRQAGADHVSIGSVFFHPTRAWRLLRDLRRAGLIAGRSTEENSASPAALPKQ